MELTPEQRAVVEADDVDIAVSAGAGSGKTHVLVEKYVRLLERWEIPQIVAVTFTDAAAAEMRQRVRREVMTRDSLAGHRAQVDEAVIGTIHSLCLRLLREHPVEAGIDPTAQVLAEDEGELLRRLACTAAVDAAAECGDGRTEVLRVLGVYHVGQVLPMMLAARDDVGAAFASLPADAEGIARVWRARVDAACDKALTPLRSLAEETLTSVAALVVDRRDLLASRVERAAHVVGDADAGDTADWAARLRAMVAALDLRGGRDAAWKVPLADVKEELKCLREAAVGALAAAPLWNEVDDAVAATLPGLRALFEDACQRYAEAKRERHTLDFLDLEIAAVRLLESAPAVLQECRARYRHLMVDEAQDVNPLQARLVRLLAGDASVGPLLFLVGDEKQSIYGFRGADVRQFRQLRDLVGARGGRLLPLSRSFRAHDALVARGNELFAHVFAARGGVAVERMTGRGSDTPAPPHLVLAPLAVTGRSEEEGRRRRLVEADLVAGEIAAMLREQRQVWDKRAASYRAVRAGDVAVLLRRFTNVHIFEQALEAHAVPYATPSGTGFFGRQEVCDLANLLRWLAEPDDDIALVAVLRSPLFILGDDTLFALRSSGRSLPLALADPPPAVAPDERQRCAFAAATLGDLRRAAHTDAAADLIESALGRTGFEASWAPVAGGEQVLANIRKLVRIARNLAGFSLSEVVDYLQQRREEVTAREAPAVLDRPDAVQVMTVHGAKGLEFPVVFVPEAHLAAQAGWPPVIWRRGEGVSFTLERGADDRARPRPASYVYLRSLDQRDEEDEHLRLFYVAATRAADYLFVSGDDGKEAGWLNAARSALADGALGEVELRPAAPPDTSAIVRRSTPPVLTQAVGQEYAAPLLLRPRVIPVRASTPVTALRLSASPHGGHGDGLGLLRGRIAHRAIEARYARAVALDVASIAREEAGALDSATHATLCAEVEEMLDRFAASEIGRAVEAAGDAARFELPFAWGWDGIPVHGQIDLLYPDSAGWRVVDFKTDRVSAATLEAVARPYLVQIGLYAGALGAATGTRPSAGLFFLRDGTWYEPGWDSVQQALAEARARIDVGLLLDPELSDYLGADED